MPFTFRVFVISNEDPGSLEKKLNEFGQQGYRVVGVIPSKTAAGASIILEKEKELGPAAGVIRQRAPGS